MRILTTAVAVSASLICMVTIPGLSNAQVATWVRLGTVGTNSRAQSECGRPVIAASDDWPTGRALLVKQGCEWHRSIDGGTSWSHASLPSDISDVRIPPSGSAQRVLFGLAPSGLYRSTDDARTWQVVKDEIEQLLISPAFASDGSTVLLDRGAAYRSADRGATWMPLTPPDGSSSFSSIAFSPTFSQDSTLFAVANAHPFVTHDWGNSWSSISPGDDIVIEALLVSPDFAHDHTVIATLATPDPPDVSDLSTDDQSWYPAGILVSQDAGVTWTAAQGLDSDGLPYRWHPFVQLSPTFAQDRTAFAFGYGPGSAVTESPPWQIGPVSMLRRALFRSNDAGATWRSVSVASVRSFPSPYNGERLVLSPNFARDHFALRWMDLADVVGRGSYCYIWRTDDGGDSWEQVRKAGSYLEGDQGCADLAVGGPPNMLLAAFVPKINQSGDWQVATLRAPAVAGLPNGPVAQSPLAPPSIPPHQPYRRSASHRRCLLTQCPTLPRRFN